MSFIADTLKRYTGQHSTGSSRVAHETHQVHETRSFDIPVKESSTKDFAGGVRDELSRTAEALEGIKTEVANLESMQDSIKNFFEEQKKDTAENIHKENVKVYRNVQAAVDDSLADQTKAIRGYIESAGKDGSKLPVVLGVVNFALDIIILAVLVLHTMGIF